MISAQERNWQLCRSSTAEWTFGRDRGLFFLKGSLDQRGARELSGARLHRGCLPLRVLSWNVSLGRGWGFRRGGSDDGSRHLPGRTENVAPAGKNSKTDGDLQIELFG